MTPGMLTVLFAVGLVLGTVALWIAPIPRSAEPKIEVDITIRRGEE
jgi:hypothetical protein